MLPTRPYRETRIFSSLCFAALQGRSDFIPRTWGFNRSPYYSMVRTVSSGFDAEVKRPGRMILQFIKTLLQTQIRQYSLGEEEVKRPAFGILH